MPNIASKDGYDGHLRWISLPTTGPTLSMAAFDKLEARIRELRGQRLLNSDSRFVVGVVTRGGAQQPRGGSPCRWLDQPGTESSRSAKTESLGDRLAHLVHFRLLA